MSTKLFFETLGDYLTMNNFITMWRSYKDFEKSIECLHIKDLNLVAKLQCSMVIKEFIYKLEDKEEETPITDNNLNIKYYWNNGKPFLYDLVEYYRFALWYNVKQGGDDFDYLKDFWDYLDDNEYRCNESNWDDDNGRVHLISLMERKNFWYKRFNINYKDLKLKDNSMYTKSGKPRSIKESQVVNHTYSLERNDAVK